MSWADVDLTEVSPDNELLPEDRDYVFELLAGAKPNQFNPNRIEVAARVAEGEFTGRVLYFSYPDPDEQPWVRGVFVRMVKAIGQELNDDEKYDPVRYLNRVAGGKFVTKVKHRQVSSNGDDITKVEPKIGNVKAYKG